MTIDRPNSSACTRRQAGRPAALSWERAAVERRVTSGRRWWVCATWGGVPAVMLLAMGACEHKPSGTGPQPAQAGDVSEAPELQDEARSPSGTLRLIRRFRADGALHRLRPYLLPEHRDAVIDHLLAVDVLVNAHRALKKAVSERIGVGSATEFDPDAVANIAGVFSPDVRIISEAVEGGRARLKISVASRVPLEEVQMRLVEDRWVLETDPPIPGLSAEIRKLAGVADRVVIELRSRPMTAPQVRDELRLRQAPILKRIATLTGSAEGTAP